MGHSVENGSQYENQFRLWKIGHGLKNVSHGEKWVKLKNDSHCKKCVAVWKIGQTLKNGPRCEKLAKV